MKSMLFALAAVIFLPYLGNAQTIEDGLKNLDAERYKKAEEIFTGLVSSNPTTENYFQLGRYYLSTPDAQANIAKAEEAFSKGSDLDKKGDPLNTIGSAWIKIAQKDFAGAKVILEDLFKKGKYEKDAALNIRAAEGYVLFPWANDPGEAILYLDKAFDVKKEDNPQLYVIKAKAHIIQNEGGEAMNALQNALTFGAKDKANIYSLMAKIWLQGKSYKEADSAIQNALAADPEFAPAYYYKSSYLQTYQKWDEAAAAAKQYLQFSDGDCEAKLRYVKLAFTAKAFEDVLSTLKEIESCNEDPIVHRLSGISKYELGRPEEAIKDLKNFVEVAPKEEIFGLDYGFIGRAYMALNDEANMEQNDIQGIEYMEKAVAMEDTTYDYFTYLGGYFQEKKDYENAALFFKKALESKKNPTGQDWFNLGILQYQVKDWENADKSFDKVCAAYTGDYAWAPPYILSARIKTYLHPEDSLYSYTERYQEYLNILGDEGKANPANLRDVTDALRYLAGHEWVANYDIPKAVGYLDELLKYDPENQQAKQLKNQILGKDDEEEAPADSTATSPEPMKSDGQK
ncbi:hypothetical protein LAG90_06690 [Marinilongibacter aquaticus]|uniref:tetratricopeptide repeat protein n=1 Tax=Marinilongibacter aquaticus TaxID=2975157 RepID=UPI0021BDA29D|nr:hypothetical protein [Marinilongibacter aquaticus]UBM60330.1 hypothetical protein LAG90_06690 [Marinilongibacter aquaticus]